MATELNSTKSESEQVDGSEQTRGGNLYRPNVDIVELPEELIVFADMPGLGADVIDIRFEDANLTIHGRTPARQPDDVTFLVREYGVGDFYRTFRISENIDASRIRAEYGDGVLALHLPKSEAVKPRKIAVEAK